MPFLENMIVKKDYTSPVIEQIIVFVEKGYQASGNNNDGLIAPGWG